MITGREKEDIAPSPWQNNDSLVAELKTKAEPINYMALSSNISVLMLGEHHDNSAIRNHLASYVIRLKNAGITHYAIEAPQCAEIELLNTGHDVNLSSVDLGPFSHRDSSYEKAVRAMASAGITIVPIDIDQSNRPLREQRESSLADGIRSILSSDPAAKIAVLIGANHTDKTADKYMTKGLIDEGVGVRVVQFVGGNKTDFPKHFMQSVDTANLGGVDFMMDLRPYHDQKGVVFGANSTDFVIHLSEQANQSHDERSLGYMALS